MSTVYAAFTLDIIHLGHLNILEKASTLGTLTLGVLTDSAVAGHRSLPINSFDIRMKIASQLKHVTKVVPQNTWSYVDNILLLKPTYFIHGDDWLDQEPSLRDSVISALNSYGGQLVEIPHTDTITSALTRYQRAQQLTSSNRLSSLRRLLRTDKLVKIIEAHNPMSALIGETLSIETNGSYNSFDGFWSSSLTDSTSMGLPDIEVLDFSRRLTNINNIFDVTTKPLVLDIDTGGISEHLAINLQSLERIGVSAIIIEDKTGLKKNSLLGNDVSQTQASISDFCTKLRCAVNARRDPNFMIIARIESLILEAGMDDALSRAAAYIESGADGIMIHSRLKDPDEIFFFAQQFRSQYLSIPLFCVPTSYNQVTESELHDNGFNVVIYANHLLRAAYPAMYSTAKMILQHQRSLEADNQLMAIKDILNLIPGTI